MSGRSGGWCRDCHNAYNREKRKDPAYRAARNATRQLEHAKLLADPARLSHRRRGHRSAQLRRNYGIDANEYDAMLAKQGGCCACCGTDDPGPGRGAFASFRVDHDHSTGAVRGLLCNTCNVGIGLLGDTVEALSRALTYLTSRGVDGRANLADTDLSVPLQ